MKGCRHTRLRPSVRLSVCLSSSASPALLQGFSVIFTLLFLQQRPRHTNKSLCHGNPTTSLPLQYGTNGSGENLVSLLKGFNEKDLISAFFGRGNNPHKHFHMMRNLTWAGTKASFYIDQKHDISQHETQFHVQHINLSISNITQHLIEMHA